MSGQGPDADPNSRALPETRTATRDAWGRLSDAIETAPDEIREIYDSLSWYTRGVIVIVVGAGVNWAYNQLLSAIPPVLEYVSSSAFETVQALLAPVQISIGQILMSALGVLLAGVISNTLTLIRIESKVEDMAAQLEDDNARPDGGKTTGAKTSGGGAIGGAIAGGALGFSFGPGGLVAGALLGAMLLDELEERSRASAKQPRDETGRFKSRER